MPVGEACVGPWLCRRACEFMLRVVDVDPTVEVPLVVDAARTLRELACAIPVAEACIGPWLRSRRCEFMGRRDVPSAEVTDAPARTLCEFAWAIPLCDACTMPWLLARH